MNDSDAHERDDLDRWMDGEEARNPGFRKKVEEEVLWRQVARLREEMGLLQPRTLEEVLDEIRREGAYRLEWLNTGEGEPYKLNGSLWVQRGESGDYHDLHVHGRGDTWIAAAVGLLDAIHRELYGDE